MKKYKVYSTDDRGDVTEVFWTSCYADASERFNAMVSQLKDGTSGRDVEVTLIEIKGHYSARPELTEGGR